MVLYIDNRAASEQREHLAAIYLGQAGGTTLRNFAAAISEVCAVAVGRHRTLWFSHRFRVRLG